MTGYFYRRPENSIAADAYEKWGCLLMSGLDIFTTDLVTYENQKIITVYNPERSLLANLASKTWNVVKLIFIPLSVVGVIILDCSTSYAQFTGSIETYQIKTEQEAVRSLWQSVYGTEPFNYEKVGDRHIWDFVVDARKKYIAQRCKISEDNVDVDRETGLVQARMQRGPFRYTIECPIENISMNTPQSSNDFMGVLAEIESKIKVNQFGRFNHLVRRYVTAQEKIAAGKELERYPHRVLILCDDTFQTTKGVKFGVYSNNRFRHTNQYCTDLSAQNLEQQMILVANSGDYSEKIREISRELSQLVESKKQELSANPIEDLSINENTFFYEYRLGNTLHTFPLDTSLEVVHNLMGSIAEAHNTVMEVADDSSANTSNAPLMSLPFLELESKPIPVGTSCSVHPLIDTLFKLGGEIPESHPRKNIYIIHVDRIQKMLWEHSNENWSALEFLLKRLAPLPPEEKINQFINLIDALGGKDLEAVLYELHCQKQHISAAKNLSFRNLLLRHRDGAIDRYIKEVALIAGCDDGRVRRELVRLGVGISYPPIQIPSEPLPEALESADLLGNLQSYVTANRLVPADVKIPYKETDLYDIRPLTDRICLTQKPYCDDIKSAKKHLKQMCDNVNDFHFDIYQARMDNEIEVIKEYARINLEAHPTLDLRVVALIERMRKELEAIKDRYPNRLDNSVQSAQYLESKEQLLKTALKEYRRMKETEKRDVRNGDLSDQFYNEITHKMLQERGFLKDGFYTNEFIEFYASSLV